MTEKKKRLLRCHHCSRGEMSTMTHLTRIKRKKDESQTWPSTLNLLQSDPSLSHCLLQNPNPSIPVLIQKLKLPLINLTQVLSHVYYPLTTKSPIIITTSFTSRPDRTSPYPIKRALLAKKNSLGLRRKTCITFLSLRTLLYVIPRRKTYISRVNPDTQ